MGMGSNFGYCLFYDMVACKFQEEMKYIVTYFIIMLVSYTPSPEPDEFGRMPTPHFTITGLRTDTIRKRVEFIIREEALGFIERGRADSADKPKDGIYDYWPPIKGRLAHFKLDSLSKK